MPESASIPVYRSAADAELGQHPDPAPSDPSAAVRRCCVAYQRAVDAGKGTQSAFAHAKWAYIGAMPHLTDLDSIRDFTACVVRAMLLKICPDDTGVQLLRAARLAIDAIPRPPRPLGRPRKPSKNPLPQK